VPTPILGLQAQPAARPRADTSFFGLAGPREGGRRGVLEDARGRPRPAIAARSITHGGFDNDIPTMTSVVRRGSMWGHSTARGRLLRGSGARLRPRGRGLARAVAAPAAAQTRGRRSGPHRGGAAGPRKKAWTVMVWMAGTTTSSRSVTRTSPRCGVSARPARWTSSCNSTRCATIARALSRGQGRRRRRRRGGGTRRDEHGRPRCGGRLLPLGHRALPGRAPARRDLEPRERYRTRRTCTAGPCRAAMRARARTRHPVGPSAPPALREDGCRGRCAIVRFAYDDTARDFLDNLELKRVLAEVKRQTGRVLDVLGFDACLMNMVEAAYQLEGHRAGRRGVRGGGAGRRAGPTTACSAVWRPSPRSRRRAGRAESWITTSSRIAREHHAVGARPVPLDEVAGRVDALAAALLKAIRTPAEYAGRHQGLNATQRFDMPDFVDLGHFCTEVAKRSRRPPSRPPRRPRGRSWGEGWVRAGRATQGPRRRQRDRGGDLLPARGLSTTYGRLDFARRRLAAVPRGVSRA